MHVSAKEIQVLRQDFERGLLAAIMNEQRASGVAMMGGVARALSRKDAADNTWHCTALVRSRSQGRHRLEHGKLRLLRDMGDSEGAGSAGQ